MNTYVISSLLVTFLTSFVSPVIGKEISVRTPSGDYLIFDVPADAPFSQVIEDISNQINDNPEEELPVVIDFTPEQTLQDVSQSEEELPIITEQARRYFANEINDKPEEELPIITEQARRYFANEINDKPEEELPVIITEQSRRYFANEINDKPEEELPVTITEQSRRYSANEINDKPEEELPVTITEQARRYFANEINDKPEEELPVVIPEQTLQDVSNEEQPVVIDLTQDPTSTNEVTVKIPSGDYIIFDVPANAPFSQVLQDVSNQINDNPEEELPVILDFNPEQAVIKFTNYTAGFGRDYTHQVTAKEKEDLRYILKTLATASYPKLFMVNSSLQSAGDRIDHLHPLRFWQTIFTDNELKDYVHVIRGRNKVWKEFYSNCSDRLNQEANANNITDECISTFARSLNVSADLFQSDLVQRKWSSFVDTLLTVFPRNDDSKRYD